MRLLQQKNQRELYKADKVETRYLNLPFSVLLTTAVCWPNPAKFSISADNSKILSEIRGPSIVNKTTSNRIFEIKLYIYICGVRYLNL